MQFLGQEDPLGKDRASHSSVPTWRIPWTEEPGRYSPRGRRVGHDGDSDTFSSLSAALSPFPASLVIIRTHEIPLA